jgi:hypothetical protein
MARTRQVKPKLMKYEPGSPELEALLSSGYGMNLEDAERIIKERDENPHTHPYEEYKKAKAFIEALNSSPVAVSTEPGWHRTKEG